jgi:hypothetical protein
MFQSQFEIIGSDSGPSRPMTRISSVPSTTRAYEFDECRPKRVLVKALGE